VSGSGLSGSGVTTYTFGNFILDRPRACLLRDGQEIKLRPKSFELLVYLVENPGRLITKDELMKTVWPDSFVTDDSLVQCVRDIRRVLEDDSQQYIKTVPRRGYIFEADVTKNGAGSRALQITPEINVEGPMPAAAAAGPSVVEGLAKRLPARRFWLRLGPGLLALAVIPVVLALYPSKNTPAVWRAVPLTSYPGMESNPALSPDNRSVAFTWNGNTQDNFDIHILALDSGRPQRLTTDPAQDTNPAWSPNGDKIAFLRRVDRDRNHLVLIPGAGGAEHILTETRNRISGGNFNSDLRMNLAWTPDGQWIVVKHRETEGPSEGFYLVSVSTGEKRLLIETPTGYIDENPAFSPKGDAIAFARGLSRAASELYLVPLSKDYSPSGSARRLTDERGQVANPVWSKDGSRIFYRFGSELHVINAQSSGVGERILLESREVAQLSLERDLVYSQTVFDPNIWRAEIPNRNGPPTVPHLLISSTRIDNSARYSPNGKAIAFISSRSGHHELWIANADGLNPVQLTSFGASDSVRWPNWSHDGQRLVFHARPEGQSDLFSVAASGGPAKRLTSDPFDDLLASYSRDDRWIYFTSTRSGQSEVWKMPADGGEATRLTVDGGVFPMESPDGKSVFYALMPAGKGIGKVPVDGGEAVQVTGPVATERAFVVSEDGLYYATPPESSTRHLIQFLDFSTGQSRPVVVTDREIGLGMSLSRDGRFLIFPQRDQVGSDLMLIRDFGARN
jgi:Tol biopolymer transport system component/DNA-binding winged helix-turn-helix (wHTH) protein